MANKANAADVLIHSPYEADSLDLHGERHGSIPVVSADSPAASPANAPEGVNWGTCLSLQYGSTRQLLLVDSSGDVYAQGCVNGNWGPWRKAATAEPIEWHDLPLQAGFTAFPQSGYGRTQDGLLIIDFTINKEAAPIVNCEVIAYLPEGFRPSMDKQMTATYYSGCHAGFIVVRSSGAIEVLAGDFLEGHQMVSFNATIPLI